ncbi:hypothetical protein C4K24_1926 [Pseudomonas chlororaphis subsp. aurantiaca]|uniref:hypothetical protein n=1 Tax=Pseudomonas chlororaphis TaxID=587753 RepID=UPI000F5746DF|nr:hypothetical protein [Pseudomonas chlororaphis]AZD21239.1 hypothetical protein C4K24_1926 [Pseudomonas chlororaphis subsp. aurantiaca]
MTTTLNNAYNTWRQFAPQEKSLTPITGPRLNVHAGPSSDGGLNAAFSGLIAAATNAGNRYEYSQKRKGLESEAKAETWMKSVSPEEFRKAAQEGNLPFQDDPIAMARLRYLHGFHASSAVQSQVAENIRGGAYKDELDAQGKVIRSGSDLAVEDYFNKMKSMRADITKELGFNEEDEALTNGMFRNSDDAQVSLMGLQTQAADARNRAQAEILHTSIRSALLSEALKRDPKEAAQVAIESWTTGYQTGVYRNLPDTLKDVGKTLSQVSAQSGGLAAIDLLLDAQVPGTEKTVRDFYDGDELEGFRQKALNTQVKMDASADLDWQVQVQNHQDDPNGLTGLFQMYHEELGRSGGVASKRTQQLQQEITSKKHSLATAATQLQKENAKAALQSARVAVLTQEAGRFLAGNRDAQRYDTMPKDPDLGKYSKDDALLMERGLLERYQAQPAKLLKIADYMPNGYIANTIQDYWKDTSASMAVDASRISQGLMRPEDIKEPEALASVNLLKTADPLAFRKVIGGDTQALAKLDTLDVLAGMGLGYKDMVISQARWHKMSDKEKLDQTNKITKVLESETVSPKNIGKVDGLTNLAGSEYAQTYMKTMVNGLLSLGIPEEEAFKKADSAFAQSHVGLNGFPIPASFFSAIQSPDQVNVGMDLLAGALTDYARSQGVREEDVIPDYNQAAGTVGLRSPGRISLEIRADSLQQGAQALAEKRLQDALVKNAEGTDKGTQAALTKRSRRKQASETIEQGFNNMTPDRIESNDQYKE